MRGAAPRLKGGAPRSPDSTLSTGFRYPTPFSLFFFFFFVFEIVSAMQTQLLASAVLVLLLVQVALAIPPALDRNLPEDYSENALEQLLGRSDKRGCIQRGGGCDARPNDCCPNSACRCNLWGTNCRCDRQGLFQQWGRRK